VQAAEQAGLERGAAARLAGVAKPYAAGVGSLALADRLTSGLLDLAGVGHGRYRLS
jgi:hypothetical protein